MCIWKYDLFKCGHKSQSLKLSSCKTPNNCQKYSVIPIYVDHKCSLCPASTATSTLTSSTTTSSINTHHHHRRQKSDANLPPSSSFAFLQNSSNNNRNFINNGQHQYQKPIIMDPPPPGYSSINGTVTPGEIINVPSSSSSTTTKQYRSDMGYSNHDPSSFHHNSKSNQNIHWMNQAIYHQSHHQSSSHETRATNTTTSTSSTSRNQSPADLEDQKNFIWGKMSR